MMRLILRPVLLIILLFNAALIVALIIGQSFPPKPILGALGVCDGVPCLGNIIPGVTSFHDANGMLAFIPETECAASSIAPRSNNIQDLFLLEIHDCQELLLGDLIGIMGEPDGLYSANPVLLSLYDGLVMLVLAPASEISLYTHVTSVTLVVEPYRMEMYPWRGFLTEQRYCQSYPSMIGC